MRRAVTAVSVAAVGVTAALLTGGAVAADASAAKVKNHPCVNSVEFSKATSGMSKAQVAKIFGTKGVRISIGKEDHGYTREVRQYKACKHPTAIVQVAFDSGDTLPTTKVGWLFSKSWYEQWTQ